jgi:hypothetical protein
LNLRDNKRGRSNEYVKNFFGRDLNKRFSNKTTIDGFRNSKTRNFNNFMQKRKKRFNKGIRRRSFGG